MSGPLLFVFWLANSLSQLLERRTIRGPEFLSGDSVYIHVHALIKSGIPEIRSDVPAGSYDSLFAEKRR